MEESDEATLDQLHLARRQGDALQEAVLAMTREARRGEERQAGDFLIGYAVEKAEGLYHLRGGKLEWVEPQEENAHIEIVVRDAADGRFLPALQVQVSVEDERGNAVGTHEHPFLWHPWLYHYGRNWRLPGDGTYALRVRVATPTFPRHDRINGKRYLAPAEVEFTGVRIQTGQKSA